MIERIGPGVLRTGDERLKRVLAVCEGVTTNSKLGEASTSERKYCKNQDRSVVVRPKGI